MNNVLSVYASFGETLSTGAVNRSALQARRSPHSVPLEPERFHEGDVVGVPDSAAVVTCVTYFQLFDPI